MQTGPCTLHACTPAHIHTKKGTRSPRHGVGAWCSTCVPSYHRSLYSAPSGPASDQGAAPRYARMPSSRLAVAHMASHDPSDVSMQGSPDPSAHSAAGRVMGGPGVLVEPLSDELRARVEDIQILSLVSSCGMFMRTLGLVCAVAATQTLVCVVMLRSGVHATSCSLSSRRALPLIYLTLSALPAHTMRCVSRGWHTHTHTHAHTRTHYCTTNVLSHI